MALEQKKQENRTLDNTLRAGLVATSLFGAHDNMQAAEIPRDATWKQGVELLQQSVRESAVEAGATFIVYTDGSTGWLPPAKGEQLRVVKPPPEIVEEIGRQRGERNVALLCDIHTHPKVSIEQEYKIPDARYAYSPPSYGDTFVVSRGGRQEDFPKLAGKPGFQVEHFTAALFEPRGAWYWRHTTDEERARQPADSRKWRDIVDEFEKKQTDFVTASANPNFDLNSEYPRIREAYRKITTEVRFVPYEKIHDEPPCAGPDYVPEKK